MRLEKLEIHGFKSFGPKTVLEFPDKFTAIVGPNGSGKSNIVDAICFVLGKSRGLRVGNLRELIHNGGAEGRESQFARITLYLADDNSKTKITREINAEGQGIYRIDGKKVPRQEIIDLVGDNEYNILLQDDITKVIEMQSRERRQIIDNLCGIGEYDKKKAKAIKELEQVENRISDTHIVLGEKNNYLQRLEREKNDALKYKSLNSNLEKCSASIIHLKLTATQERLAELEASMQEYTGGKNTLREHIEHTRTQIAQENESLKELNKNILELEKEKGFFRIPELKTELVRKTDRLEILDKSIQTSIKSLDEKTQKKTKLEEKKTGLDTRIASSSEKLVHTESQIREESVHVEQNKLEEEIDAVKTKIFELKSRIIAINESEAERNKRIENFKLQEEDMQSRIKQAKERAHELDKQIGDRSRQHKGEFEEFAELRKSKPQIESRLQKIQGVLEGLKVEYATKKSEIETVEKQSGGIKGAVRAVNRLKSVIDGVYGPIFQLGKVLNPEYETAMNIAAGGRMYNIVVRNEDTAIKCIKYLREKKVGRATFLPLTRINFRKNDHAPRGSIGFARNFITTNSEYKPAFDYVFGNTVLVRDIGDAKDIGVGKCRMVTLKGDLMSESGAMTGGFARKVEIGFSQVDDLEIEVKRIEQRIIELDGERQELLIKKARIDEKLSKLEFPVSSGRTDVEKIRLEREALDDKIEDYKYRTEEIEHVIKGIKQSITEDKEKIRVVQHEIKIKEKDLEKLSATRTDTLAERLEKLKDKHRDLEIEKKTLEEKRDLALEQIAETTEEITRLDRDLKSIQEEKSETEKEKQQIEEELGKMEEENSELTSQIEKLVDQRILLEKSLTALGRDLGSDQHKLRSVEEQINKILIRKSALDAKLSGLTEDFEPYRETEIIPGSLEELGSMEQDMRSQLQGIGSVNLRSIETYDTVKEEYDQAIEKLDTLKNERQSIFDFMEKVEHKKRETFNEAFDFVKTNFEKFYNELADGEGTLILTNPRDISNSGLIIKASPKGKKLINLDSMSGGEKVLTCSAFLLAIQQYKPAYFYIVDEIDAALDKKNALKLAQILRGSSAQFLLISHNDEVIKNAQSVIGVSMSKGVSQIVGVKLT